MLVGAPVGPRRPGFDMGSTVRHSPKRDRRSALASAGGEARPMAALTASEGVSRLLSLVFYVVAARSLTTEGFGVLRYTVALALLIFALLAVLTTTVTREIGAARGNDLRTGEVLGSGLAVAALLVGVSSVVCVAASLLGLTGGADLLGLLAVGVTFTIFQLYYAISRGVGDASRAAIAYVCASAAQLILLVGLGALLEPSAGLALFAYGASSVLPVLAFELRRPLIRGRALSVRRVELDRIWKLSAPLVLAQAGFVVWFSVDQIWIESALTTEDVGLYGAAKTLSQVFLVLPAGVTGVLLPRVAELRTAGDAVRARRLVYWATLGSMLFSAVLALAVVLPGTELLEAIYGDRYGAAADSLTGLAVAMVFYTGFMTLANAAVGWGRPAVYSIGMVVTALAQLACLALIWDDQAATAAWASAISMGIGFLLVLGLLVARPFRDPSGVR